MTRDMKDEHKKNKRDFIDPATTVAVGWFVFAEVAKACIAFFTMRALRLWFVKKAKERKLHEGISDKTISKKK